MGLFIFSSPSFSQVEKDVNLQFRDGVYLYEETADPEYGAEPYVRFPNLNFIPYFRDEKQIKLMDLLRENGSIDALDSLLTGYISNFGVKNFRDDVGLLWLLGKTREEKGDTSGALLYYELGLNHQRDPSGMIKSKYDSLSSKFRSDWVDLQFYYRLLEARRKIDPLIPPQGVMLNMGKKVNSEKADYAPFMHPSDSVLIFTSRRDEEIIIDDFYGKKNEDLFYVERDFMDGTWSFSQKFSKSINSEHNEGSACLSPDGKTLFFARCDDPLGFGSCDIYTAEFIGGDWEKVRNLGTNVNTEYWESQPSTSPDGSMLFFTSNREGGFGGSDLFVSYKQEDGSFGPALNLGPVINTYENEVTPFFHQVNKTLYFSSTGHLSNVGGYDIFKARWLGDHWESPKNLGPLVNSRSHEYYFSIDGKATRLFFSKAKPGDDRPELQQDFDLFSFPLPMEARPDAVASLKGFLMDSISGQALTGVVLVLDKTAGIEIAPKFINPSGYFEFDLIRDHYYEIYIQGENYFTIKEDIELTSDSSFTALTAALNAGKPVVFESFNFEENSYELNKSIEPRLDYIARFLKRYPMYKLQIAGHTDSDGDAKYNLQLSRKRANKIMKYIVAVEGIEPGRVMANGFGETRPMVPNKSVEGKKINRRVEFSLIFDATYTGTEPLPMESEIEFDETELFDPEFERENTFEFDWSEEDDLDSLLLEDEDPILFEEFDDWEGDESGDSELNPELDEDLDSLTKEEDEDEQ